MTRNNIDLEQISFSVVIPLYNKEDSVQSTIQSVLDQTYPNFELIIVDDGSTDNSLAVAKSFEDHRIRIIEQQNNGVSSARNRGIKNSKYTYVIPLDADDLWLPYALEELLYLIRNFPDARVFTANFNMSGKSLKGSSKRYYVEDYYYALAVSMAKWNIPLMVTGIVTIHRDCFHKSGNYDEKVTHGEDIDLWTRLAKHCTIAKSEVVIMIYRVNEANRASDVTESAKIFPGGVIEKNRIHDKSQQLFIGCQLFSDLYIRGLNRKESKPVSFYLPYWWWIFRAFLLYVKFRFLKALKFV